MYLGPMLPHGVRSWQLIYPNLNWPVVPAQRYGAQLLILRTGIRIQPLGETKLHPVK